MVGCCDDFGRFDARPAIVRAHCFPLALDRVSLSNVSEWLQKLVKVGLIVIYTVDGKEYGAMSKWDNHQRIRNKRSRFPEPQESNLLSIDSKCPQSAANRGLNPDPNPDPDPNPNPDPNENKKENKKEKERPQPSIDSVEIAKHLYDRIMGQEFGRATEVGRLGHSQLRIRLEKWAHDIDRIMRIDKRTKSELLAVIDFAHDDNIPRGNSKFCWAKQVKSPKNLRHEDLWIQFSEKTSQKAVSYGYGKE